ncbi:hypothetical protein [uncultured Pseudokineococcus sp.]|uniref:hypothetical protein n=1 Tax=uncultured Pseudokineococcus sp. TaxID=1642928 RepID=UPI00262E49E6|nr:hypothetical protein [uncultured Pseudokineococcus sp.]
MNDAPSSVPGVPDPQQIFARIRNNFLITQEPSPTVQDGSASAGDDAATAPLHLSHAAWLALTLALDKLEAVRALVEDAHRTQPWAHHTLLRSALEHAATAVWLLAPASRDERIRRRLKLAGHDVYESGRAQELSGVSPAPPGRLPAERYEEIRELARARGFEDPDAVLGRFSYVKVVREAATATALPADVLELLWMTGSGIAHGRAWATFAMLEHEDVTLDNGDVRQISISASIEQLTMIAATVLNLVELASALYEQRRSRHH